MLNVIEQALLDLRIAAAMVASLAQAGVSDHDDPAAVHALHLAGFSAAEINRLWPVIAGHRAGLRAERAARAAA